MQWTIPGTALQAETQDAAAIEQQFAAMFLPGGMVLSQVCALTGLEPYTVQNWVKRGFLTKPKNKRYSQRQLCRIINISMLKTALPMEEICGLLTYVNGELDNESDDLIDDSMLYFIFVRLAARYQESGSATPAGSIEELTRSYTEPLPGARQRVQKVLQIMLTAWCSSQLQKRAERMIAELPK